MTGICGIYKLGFQGTDKVYIGLSTDIYRRFRGHKHTLSKGLGSPKLQSAYNLYGLPAMETLVECDAVELDRWEKEAISIYDSIDNGFNSRDGGATGNSNADGSKNGRALYDTDQYISVFKELVHTATPYKTIADSNSVSIQVVEHIASGVSHKKWLQELFPQEYNILISKLGNRQLTNTIFISIATGEEVHAHSIKEFAEKYNIPKSSVSSVVTGRYTSVGPWKLKVPVIYSPTKKVCYILIYDSIEYSVTNVSEFCRIHNITNRKGFTKLLKGESLEYKGWKLK